MASLDSERRQCPTRANGGHPLIAHWITLSTCTRRRREHFHKCYTCVYGNGREAPIERRAEPLRVVQDGGEPEEVSLPAAEGV